MPTPPGCHTVCARRVRRHRQVMWGVGGVTGSTSLHCVYIKSHRATAILRILHGWFLIYILNRLLDPNTSTEIANYPIYKILFCVRGHDGTPESDCFAFTESHYNAEIFRIHVFRCQIQEAVRAQSISLRLTTLAEFNGCISHYSFLNFFLPTPFLSLPRRHV